MLLVLLMLLTGAPGVLGHEIPGDARIEVLAILTTSTSQPPAERLELFVRTPLETLRDVDFPLTAAGWLDAVRGRARLPDAVELWIGDEVTVLQHGRALTRPTLIDARFAVPGEPRAYSLAGALALQRPLPDGMALPWRQADVVAHYRVPLPAGSDGLELDSDLHHLGIRTRTSLTVLDQRDPAAAGPRTLLWQGDAGRVPLRIDTAGVVGRFLRLGVEHIVLAADHLFFIACLALPANGLRRLLGVITAFTLAHAVTLAAAVLGWIPVTAGFSALVEWAVAGSILLLALQRLAVDRPQLLWPLAYGFGLVHGLAFAGFLERELQWAGGAVGWALAGFNLGIELGQLLMLAVMLAGWTLARRLGVSALALRLLVFALIAHAAWHWCGERWDGLPAAPLAAIVPLWPTDAAAALALALVLALTGFGALLAGMIARGLQPPGLHAGDDSLGASGHENGPPPR